MRGGRAEPSTSGEALASLCPEGVDPRASQNRSGVLAATASGGRGRAGSQPADPRGDQRQAAGSKLPWFRPEFLDIARPSPAASQLEGEVSLEEGTEQIQSQRRLRCVWVGVNSHLFC